MYCRNYMMLSLVPLVVFLVHLPRSSIACTTHQRWIIHQALRKYPESLVLRWLFADFTPFFKRYAQLKAWHKQYGKVVRLGPNRISVADKDMVQQVLMTDDFPKGPAYNRLQSKESTTYDCSLYQILIVWLLGLGGVSMLSTIDKTVHKQRVMMIHVGSCISCR